MAGQIPMVNYLVLDGEHAHLQAQRCKGCGAQYFDRRNACAHCYGTDFATVDLATTGKVRSFTIVHRAAPNVPTPYVSALVDIDAGGGVVKANIINTDPTPERVTLGHAGAPCDLRGRHRQPGHRGHRLRLRAGGLTSRSIHPRART